MSNIQDRLKILIGNMGCTQKQFSKLVGVDSGTVSRILNGSFEPKASTLKKIADTTKASPSWLLGYGDERTIERI